MKITRYRQIFTLGIVLSLFVLLASGANAQTKKIAVPTNGPEENTPISAEAGRAAFFLLFDGDGQFLEAIKNPAANQPGGISRTVISLLVENDVTVFIGDSVGDKMKKAIADKNIQFIKSTGPASDAVKAAFNK
ncbi:MAG: hypothetical protein KAR01_02410 [Desulfocapsa sp.]|nr:hypothetical protein [Desulfocapsa sp.]